MSITPGPASTVEEHPPINPAIRVRNRGGEFFMHDKINLHYSYDFDSSNNSVEHATWRRKCGSSLSTAQRGKRNLN